MTATPVQTFARERRVELAYDEYPPLVVHAFISAEDKTFFSHRGIDYPGPDRRGLRLYAKSVQRRRAPRAARPSPSRSPNICCRTSSYNVGRKIREAILAFRLESTLTKQQILELYLNSIFLGRNAYGVQAAARAYFDKDVDELTLPEAAYLAVLPKAPANYDPVRATAEGARPPQLCAAARCTRNGYITEDQRAAAAATPLGTIRYGSNEKFRQQGGYFMEEVRRELIKQFGENAEDGPNSLYAGGLWVRTSMDPVMQDAAAAGAARRPGPVRRRPRLARPRPAASMSPSDWAAQLDRGAGRHRLSRLAQGGCALEGRRRRRQIGFANGSTGVYRFGGDAAMPKRGVGGARLRLLRAGHGHHRQADRRPSSYALRSIPEVSRRHGGRGSAHRPGAGDAGRLRRRSARATTAPPRRCASRARRSSRSSM